MKFSEVRRVITFYKDGWASALDRGVPRTAILRTVAPIFFDFSEAHVEPFVFDKGKPDSPHRFGADLQDTCRRIDSDLRANSALADRVPTIIATITQNQYLLRFANALECGDLDEPTLMVKPVFDNGEPADKVSEELSSLFVGQPMCKQLSITVGKAEGQYAPNFTWKNRLVSLRDRIGFDPIRTVLLPLILKFGSATPFFRRAQVGLLTNDNPLIREAAFSFAKRGYLTRYLPQIERKLSKDPLVTHMHAAIKPHLTRFIGNWVPAAIRETILKDIQIKIDLEIQLYLSALARWRKFFEDGHKPWAGVLANLAKYPEQWALFQACKEQNLFFAAFQHGLSREICMYPRYSESTHEMTASTHFFTYNKICADIAEKGTAAQGTATPIGPPREIARAGHHRRSKSTLPSIFYVSTNLYSGITSVIRGSDTDIDMARSEHGIITNILTRLQHRVLYKPYPSRGRFLDPDPCLLAAEKAENIEIYRDAKDLSLLLPDSRLLITAHATSTLGWCMASRKPVVLIDMPNIAPLLPGLKESFADGVFLFDSSSPNFHGQLHGFLSQPISVIEQEHIETKAEGREYLIEKYYMGMRDGAGNRAANKLEQFQSACGL